MKQKAITHEQAIKRLQEIFKKRGIEALNTARNEILQERIESKQAREALTYFMTEYWNDLARPSLMSLVCEVVGGNPKVTTPLAVPMILIGGAIDIHDDIIDESETKDGRPTVYGKFGKDIALLVGDALLFKGFTLLNRALEKVVPPRMAAPIMNIIKDTFYELGDAEAMELSFRGRLDLSPERYLHMVRKKAADVEAHTRISSIIGEASSKEIEALGRYGRLLGMIIILRDDWIDILDLEESRQRIKKECLPLPLLYALQDTKVKQKLSPILLKENITKGDNKKIVGTIREAGAIDRYRKTMNELASKASSSLKELKSDCSNLIFLAQVLAISSDQEG